MTDPSDLLRDLDLSFSECALTPPEKQAHIERLLRDADLVIAADPETPPRQP